MKNWSLSRKIWGVMGLLVVAFVGSVYLSLSRMNNIRSSLDEITSVLMRRDQASSVIQDNQRQMTILSQQIILEPDFEKKNELRTRFETTLEKQKADVAAYKAVASEEGVASINKYLDESAHWRSEILKSQKLTMEKQDKEAAEVLLGAQDKLARMRDIIATMKAATAKILNDKADEADATAKSAIFLSLIFSVSSILISIVIAYFVLRSLTKAIGEIVRGLSDSSNQVTSAATQIASASEQLSQATTEQAASLEETAASVEEMNSMVAKNSENASSAASTSNKSQEAVNQGKRVIEKMIESMSAINKSSEGMAEVVKVIEQIDKKTKVINEIVNKTELLSFNASVEAARAGEHGKGFAVVAEEVGNLARMSGAAAEEIATLLESSISTVNQMVAETKKSVESGSAVTRECGEVFEEVVGNVSSVSGMATEIASASQEQSRGCAEITKAMSQLDQMTQQNAATSEECASAAEELSAQAEALKGAVTQLVFTVNGRDGSQQDSAAHPAQAPQPARKASPAKPASSNVVHLKSPQSKRAASEPQLKKASGDAPDYNSNGFNDV